MYELCREYNDETEEWNKMHPNEFSTIFKHWLTCVKVRRKKEVSSECFRWTLLASASGQHSSGVCRCRLGEDKRSRQQTAAGKKKALDEKTKHRTFFKGMKSMYNQIVALAMSMPLMVLSMIFDGMDQVQQANWFAALRWCAVENIPAACVCKNQ